MMADDKRKNTSLIIAKLRGDRMEESEAPKSEFGGEEDNSIALDSAAEEVLSAIEKKDAKALREALQSMIEMCQESESESESEA